MAGVFRDVQAAFDIVDERPVGPLPQSFFVGDNAALIASVAPLYLTGTVLDVTYGQGVWWRRFQPKAFHGSDLADGIDFRDLPHADDSWDTVCFDPPYIPSRRPETMSAKVRGDHRGAYGLNTTRTRAAVEQLIADGLAECARVARMWVLAKACDYSENERTFVLGHVSAIAAGQAAGLRVHDLIVHAGGTGPGNFGHARIHRTRRAHSYLIVFRSARKRL